jgi:hypothetical protein
MLLHDPSINSWFGKWELPENLHIPKTKENDSQGATAFFSELSPEKRIGVERKSHSKAREDLHWGACLSIFWKHKEPEPGCQYPLRPKLAAEIL